MSANCLTPAKRTRTQRVQYTEDGSPTQKPRLKPSDMSSSALPAALKRRRMGLADGLDIGSLLGYMISFTRRELTSSVG